MKNTSNLKRRLNLYMSERVRRGIPVTLKGFAQAAGISRCYLYQILAGKTPSQRVRDMIDAELRRGVTGVRAQ